MRNAVATAFVPRFAYNAYIVTTACQHECHIGGIDKIDFIDGPPWRYVIEFRRYGEDRSPNISKGDEMSVDLVAPFEQIVGKEQTAQVFAMHAIGHARRIRIPSHEIDHRRALSHEVIMHDMRPD